MQESVTGSDGISLHSVGFELFKKVLLVAMVLVCILLVLNYSSRKYYW